jgi:hypothetical protein
MKKYIVHTKDGVVRISAQGIICDDHQPVIRFFVGDEVVACVSIANIEVVVEEGHLLKK